MSVTFTVNNEEHTVDVDPDTPLLWVLRDDLRLTGSKFGCGVAQCGACTVFIDGQPTRSCITPAATVEKGEVTTIEAIAGREAAVVQKAWVDREVPQCGYCQSGQIMSAVGLIAEASAGEDLERIREGMSGNLCRCAAYHNITRAVQQATRRMAEAEQEGTA